jgi:hypothetical protein
MKDGRTALPYKAEHAVDMDTGAIVTVAAHGGAVGDTASIRETLPAAGEAIAKQMLRKAWKSWSRTRVIIRGMRRCGCGKPACGPTLPNRSVAAGNGLASESSNQQFTASGSGSRAIAASSY